MTGGPEVVYVIGTPGSNTVKIGRTVDRAKRLATIQRMSPVPLEVLWSHPGGHELETQLHRHFHNIRSHGEWFSFEADPVEAVRGAVESKPWTASAKPGARLSEEEKAVWFAKLDEATADHLREKRLLHEAIADSRAAGVPTTVIAAHSGYSREWARKIADRVDRERAA